MGDYHYLSSPSFTRTDNALIDIYWCIGVGMGDCWRDCLISLWTVSCTYWSEKNIDWVLFHDWYRQYSPERYHVCFGVCDAVAIILFLFLVFLQV